LIPAGAYAQAAAPLRIGVAGAVSGLVKATAPGAADARVMQSGGALFLNDQVTTDAKGKLQVMLLDETIFTVGPNSKVALDEFVYDPGNDAGKVSVKITKGAFRFITGKVARKEPANMKVKLPTGTIGIRGTQFYVNQAGGPADAAAPEGAAGTTANVPPSDPGAPGGGAGPAAPGGPAPDVNAGVSTIILLGPGAQNNAAEAAGAITVGNGNASVMIDQPGFGVSMAPGQATLQIQDMSQQLVQINAELSADTSQGSGESTEQAAGEAAPSEGGSAEGGSQESDTAEGGGSADSGSSVSDDAGQTTAAAGSTLADASGLGDLTQELGDSSNQAVLEILSNEPEPELGIPDGIAGWDQLRGIETGAARYRGAGLCYISGSAGAEYTTEFDLLVDFAARTYGGSSDIASSHINIRGIGSVNILSTSFDTLTGNAQITLDSKKENVSNGYFDNSQITFNNADGIAAEDVTVDIRYNDGFYSGSTQLSADRFVIPDGLSTWDQLRSIETGTVYYSGTGLATITNGSDPVDYTSEIGLIVNFGARTFGGGGATSSLTLRDSQLSVFDQAAISQTSFDALGGNAAITLSALANTDRPTFDGTQITFNSLGGVPATSATVDLAYSNDGLVLAAPAQITATPGILPN